MSFIYDIGVAAITGVGIYTALSAVNLVYVYFIRQGNDLKKYGKWAVITGATDGIGKAYAFELAKKGLDIVLVSRTQSKLEEVRREIMTIHDVEVKVVAADLYNVDASVATIKAATEGMDVGILVNNVGVSYDYPCLFHDVSDERVDQLVKLNMESLTKITRAVLPGMAERRRGAIVNVSSASGMMATPLLTAYSASKAYVDFFSRGLNTEYQHLGVQVQSLMPLYVTSKLSKIRKPTLFVPTPEAFCKSAVRMIGYERRTTGYWSHQLQVGALGFLPESIQESLLLYLNRGINKAALKKIAKNKNQ